MRIIQHRVNSIYPRNMLVSKAVEVDVQKCDRGRYVVKHDIDELYPVHLSAYTDFNDGEISEYFVNIKQALSSSDLRNIQQYLEFSGNAKVIGFFDVPFPLAYHARKDGFPVFARLSEFEPVNRLFDKFWVDPLASQNWTKHIELMSQTDPNHQLIICSPELHGDNTLMDALRLWDMLANVYDSKTMGRIVGLVTKFPLEAEKFFNGR